VSGSDVPLRKRWRNASAASIADMFKAFGNEATPNPNFCAYTWVCNTPVPDFHPRTLGYALMASSFEQLGGAKYQ
jgi:hypothetical protein